MSDILNYDFYNQIKSLSFITDIYIYGSKARGEGHNRSDIDLAVSCPGANESEWQQVLDIIEHADTLLPIDIVRLDTLPNGELKDNIIRDRRILYRKDR